MLHIKTCKVFYKFKKRILQLLITLNSSDLFCLFNDVNFSHTTFKNFFNVANRLNK